MNEIFFHDVKAVKQEEVDFDYLIGVDEAGRGPLAGPVVAGAVLLSLRQVQYYSVEHPFPHIDDSKKVTPKRRAVIYQEIQNRVHHSSASISASLIDTLGIAESTRFAWQQAVDSCLAQVPPEARVIVLLDGNQTYKEDRFPIQAVTKGDSYHGCIALASIVAKEKRDAKMRELHQDYPQYGFDQHKGYGTKLHGQMIEAYGLSPLHRRSFCKKFL